MRLIDFFDGPSDLSDTLLMAEEKIMPIIDWIDQHEDPQRRAKVSTAVFIIQTFRAVKVHGLHKDRALTIVSQLIDAINAGELDELIDSGSAPH